MRINPPPPNFFCFHKRSNGVKSSKKSQFPSGGTQIGSDQMFLAADVSLPHTPSLPPSRPPLTSDP